MGWNGSGSGNADGGAARHHAKRSSNGAARGLVAGLVVVAGAAACWFLLTGREESQPEKPDEGKRGLIGAVSPAAAPTNRVEVAPAIDPDARPTRPGVRVNGYVMLPNGKLHKIRGPVTNTTGLVKSPYAIFKHPSENILAEILTLQPGESMVGTPNYNGRFERNFLKAVNERIVINEEDEPDVKELKRALNEAKEELRQAHERGEDIEEMVMKAREEAQELARYKQELRKEVLKYASREATSVEEAGDYLAAANKMLETRGIAPMDDTPLTRIKLKMREKWEDEE